MAAMAALHRLLQTKRNIESAEIARKQPDSLKKRGISVDQILNPSNEDHVKKIEYYKRMKNQIKTEFLQFEVLRFVEPVEFSEEGYDGEGKKWDKRLSDCIKNDFDSSEPAVTDLLLEINNYSRSKAKLSIAFLESKFALFGFMRERVTEGKKTPPNLYLWQGEADAIAYSETLDKFIIVDFKVVNDLLDYWQKKTDLCGKHLHQCLVYAKLLQLHMNLDYLPPIMIVVIDRFTGRQGFFPLFTDYPKECKDKLDEYEWFKEQPPKPPLKMVKKREDELFREDIVDSVDDDYWVNVPLHTPLNEIFKTTATVGDLLKALHLDYDALNIHVPYLDE